MKVRIEHKTSEHPGKKGLFGGYKVPPSTTYSVFLWLNISEEERAIIEKFKLWNTTISTDRITVRPESIRELKISAAEVAQMQEPFELAMKEYFGQPFQRHFDTPAEAAAFENQLKSQDLPRIKNVITSNQVTIAPTQSFEL